MKKFLQHRTAIAVTALALCLLALPGVASAQTGGDLTGKVVDSQKAPLPGVTVTATNKDTGFQRSATTDEVGGFGLRGLPAGTYTVGADLASYGTVSVEGVVVNVASSRSLEITLAQSTVQETVTVVDEAPLIATSPSIGTTVSQQELQDLPLNGRQFANVAALAPGTSLAYNSDPTKPGQLTVALNGGIGRNINFTVDGGDNTDDTIGGALQNYNLDAVQEFKIQTAQYKAEYGRSSGGVLTVVTKTGTNEFHGSAYDFARRKELNGKTESEKLAGNDKGPYKRDQYGASLGGPIVKDRAHFFATYEKLKRDNQYTINTGGVVPAFDNSVIAIPFSDELATAKVTFDINSQQMLQVRYGYQKNADFYGATAQTLPSALGTLNNKYDSVLGNYTAQLGSDSLNEFVYQHTTFENGILALSNSPALIFPSGVVSGQNANTPQTTVQTKDQFKDDFSFTKNIGGARHDFKTGLAYVHEPVLGGTFETGTAGTFTLLTDDPNGPVREISVNGGGFGGFETPVNQLSAYFQDDWQVNDSLTLNLGLRYDVNSGKGGGELDQSSNAIFQYLKNQTTYTEGYLQDFHNASATGKKDTNNFAPRLGFSWDLTGEGKSVLRGGVGRFYDFPYTNATVLFPALVVQSAGFGTVYSLVDPNGIRNDDGSLFHPGQPLPSGGAIPVGGAVANHVLAPTQATPYSDQISLGYSWQVNNSLGLTFEALDARYEDIPYRFRFNSRLDANGNPMTGLRFPFSATSRMWSGDGHAHYQGLNIGFRVREEKFELQGFYTLSKAEGNILAGADEFRLGSTGFQTDYQTDRSVDSRNPDCSKCNGPLYTDARHRLTFGGTYTAPWALKV
ncbi:MAG: TonB-dependent receptor, partial [Thermoanaerobaculia bacterium]